MDHHAQYFFKGDLKVVYLLLVRDSVTSLVDLDLEVVRYPQPIKCQDTEILRVHSLSGMCSK